MEKIKVFVLIGMFVLFSGCSRQTPVTETLFAMDTYMEITVYGSSEVASNCAKEIVRLEHLLDREALQTGSVALETAEAVTAALDISYDTNGAFDPTIAPLVDAWGFYDGQPHLPTEQEIADGLKQVDYQQVTIDDTYLDTGNSRLDLGGIGKGYVSDKASQLIQNEGITSAILSLGGNVQTVGRKPDGSLWNVGIADPEHPNQTACTVLVEDKAVVTSGGYQRHFEQNGKQYHHILNPKTGFPATSDLLSVTVIGPSGTTCDALSTALFVMGREEAVSYWKKTRDFDLILMTKETIYHTPGISVRGAVKELVCLE